MAITWDYTITVLDRATKRARLTGVRTDSADPENPRTYSVMGLLEPRQGETLTQMRDRLAAMFYAKYTDDLAHEAADAAIISTYEAQLKTATEALEV